MQADNQQKTLISIERIWPSLFLDKCFFFVVVKAALIKGFTLTKDLMMCNVEGTKPRSLKNCFSACYFTRCLGFATSILDILDQSSFISFIYATFQPKIKHNVTIR